MPSAITHAFVGGTLALLAPPPLRRGRLALEMAAVSALPDLDVIAFRCGIPYAHPLGHRGLTHSLLFAALMAMAATALHRDVRARAWWTLFGLFFVAGASHGLLDACTDAGLGIGFFIPFDDRRWFLPWRPIATSPLALGAFFNAQGLAIVANEVRWVWMPVAAAVLAILWARGHPAGESPDGRSG